MRWDLVVIRSGLEDAASRRLPCEQENVLRQDRLVLDKQMSTCFVKQGSCILCPDKGTRKVQSQLYFFVCLVNHSEVMRSGVFFLFKENFLLCLLCNNGNLQAVGFGGSFTCFKCQ